MLFILHDSGTVDDSTGAVVGGQELDDDFNGQILPPKNEHPAGRPPKRRIESQTQRVRLRKCSKCHEVGHYKNTCRNQEPTSMTAMQAML